MLLYNANEEYLYKVTATLRRALHLNERRRRKHPKFKVPFIKQYAEDSEYLLLQEEFARSDVRNELCFVGVNGKRAVPLDKGTPG